ncbi:MAG: Nascent polypeptide-associated complex protein, partial [Nanoarchaeota archaeon]
KKFILFPQKSGKLVIENPSVTKIKLQGQESFQITGNISEENPEVGISQEDINAVVEKTGCTCEQAEKVLRQTGDLAEAILELS